jgi:hypothetical protein
MIAVNEIKEAISTLPESDFSELRNWLLEKDWEKWDQQIEEDCALGNLDFLVEEARAETLKDL